MGWRDIARIMAAGFTGVAIVAMIVYGASHSHIIELGLIFISVAIITSVVSFMLGIVILGILGWLNDGSKR